MGIHLAFSTAMLAAPVFATASADPSIINAFFVDDRLLVLARLTANEGTKLCGKTVRDLVVPYQLVVVSYRRGGGTVFHPPTDVVIEAGDVITVECDPKTLNELHALNA
jgi:Trk K+ transport system NAD-binding subunit